jgi:transposase
MDASSTAPSLPATACLPDDLDLLKQMIQELLATLHAQRQDNVQLRARLDQLLRRLYGPRAERFDPDQLLLFADGAAAAPSPGPPASDPAAAAAPAAKRRGHGRQQLPAHLRRERIDYTLTEAERICACCGHLRQEIGTTVTEQLDYQPASLFVVAHVQHAYACAACQGEVVRADKTPAPLAKGLPGPGLLAYVVVNKCVDHLPLYRQEGILSRQGVTLARSTLSDWMAHAADLLRPLYDEMVRRVLRTGVIHTDDTPVPVLDPTRDHTRLGRLWVHLGDWPNPYNVFDYTPDHTHTGPQKFLKKFHGYLQADAYAGYDRLYREQGVTEVACNAHSRRKFYEAKDSDPERAHRALAYYRQLYDIEEQIREAEAAARARAPLTETEEYLFRAWWEEQVVLYRQEYALPIWLEFHAWLSELWPPALPKSPLGEARTYLLNQYAALTIYLRHGFLAIDNNWAEREMKRIAIGRKNWLFAGSDAGGATAAVLYSFTSTCQRHGRDPFVYLRDVFRRLPTHPADRLAELLPDRWQPPSVPPPTVAASSPAVGATHGPAP